MQKYPAEISVFLAQNVEGKSIAELTKITNACFGTAFRASQIRSFKQNHNLKSGICPGTRKGASNKKYPEDVINFIRANYVGIGHHGMADLLNAQFGTNYTKRQMKAKYYQLRLNSGRTGYNGCSTRPVGSEKIKRAGRPTATGYAYVKVADPNVWKLKHHLIWEAAHGPIPKGMRIIFADRNPLNLAIENLIAVSGNELVRMNQNGLFFQDPEATQIGVTIAKIKAKSGELIRRRKEVHKA